MGRKQLVNIYVEPEDWKRFGEKVGARGRSDFIRNAIREKIAIPDSVVEMKKEKSYHDNMSGMYESKIQEKNKVHQDQIKQVDISLTIEEQAKAGLKEIWESHPMTSTRRVENEAGNFDKVTEDYYGIIKDDIEYWADFGSMQFTALKEWALSHDNVRMVFAYGLEVKKQERDPGKPDKLLKHE